MNNVKTGQFILARRKELGFTQNQLAEKLSVTDKAVSKWENGKCAPDISTLIPLSEVLEVSVVEILNGKRMEQTELQVEAELVLIDTMQKTKKKILLSIICTVAVVLFLLLLMPAHNYFSTISIHNMEALTEKAYAVSGTTPKDEEDNYVLKIVNKGDYLVFLIEDQQYISNVVFKKNDMFRDRYELCLVESGRSKGKMYVNGFGEDGMAVNVLYGVDLPSQYTKYTFGYRNYRYICPIEDGVVLDVFIDGSGSFTNAYDIQMME